MSTRRPASTQVPDRSLREAFDHSVASNPLVDPEIDAALIESGRKIAEQVDDAINAGMVGTMTPADVTKALYLLPHMNNVLKQMFATPESRRAAKVVNGSKGKGKLTLLREDDASGQRTA